jgi:hypothetical protein
MGGVPVVGATSLTFEAHYSVLISVKMRKVLGGLSDSEGLTRRLSAEMPKTENLTKSIQINLIDPASAPTNTQNTDFSPISLRGHSLRRYMHPAQPTFHSLFC